MLKVPFFKPLKGDTSTNEKLWVWTHQEDLIGLWADTVAGLELSFPRGQAIQGRDLKFLKMIGDSVYRINSFNSALIKGLEIWIEDCAQEKIDTEEKALRQLRSYLAFNNNLIASKVKHFFFREMPKDHRNEPFFHIDRDIFELGQRLWDLIEQRDLKNYKYFVFRYFYLLKLFYAFVYDSYRDEGVFLHFQYDKKIYEQCMQELADPDTMTTEISLREYIHNLMPCLCGLYLQNMGLLEKHIQEHSVREMFSAFVRAHNAGLDIRVEPLTWHLADTLLKIDGLIQDSLEFVSKEHRAANEHLLVQKVKDFIQTFLQMGKRLYDTDRMQDEDVYELEVQFLYDFVDQSMRLPLDKDTSQGIMKQLSHIFPGHLSSPAQKENASEAHEDLREKIQGKLGRFDEKSLKVEDILEKLNFEEIRVLLRDYAALRPAIDPKKDFLIHMFNIYHKQELPVWMFKAFPYIHIHPLHQDSMKNTGGRALVFDESVKTRFTYSLFKAFIDRNAFHSFDSYEIFTLFAHQEYLPVETYKRPWVQALMQVDQGGIKYTRPAHAPAPICLDWQASDLVRKAPEIRDALVVHCDGIKRYDLTYLMANTRSALAVAEYVAQMIIEEGHDRVFLFAPSAVGRVLSLCVGYVLKREKINVVYDVKNRNECHKVLIDMSFVTGFTAKHEWKSKLDHPINEDVDLFEFDQRLFVDQILVGNTEK